MIWPQGHMDLEALEALTSLVFTASIAAMLDRYGTIMLLSSVRLSVRPSIRHKPVLHRHDFKSIFFAQNTSHLNAASGKSS